MTGSQPLSLGVINDVMASGVAVRVRFNDVARSVCPCYVDATCVRFITPFYGCGFEIEPLLVFRK